MNPERIRKMGSIPLNGNDAVAILGVVFDWIEGAGLKTAFLEPNMGNADELRENLQHAGYFLE